MPCNRHSRGVGLTVTCLWTGGRVSVCEWSSFLSPTGARIRAGGWAGCAPPELCSTWGTSAEVSTTVNTDMVRIPTQKQKNKLHFRDLQSHTVVVFVAVASLSWYISSPWACNSVSRVMATETVFNKANCVKHSSLIVKEIKVQCWIESQH